MPVCFHRAQVYPILKDIIALRDSIKDYVYELGVNASEFGAPTMRALFYEFPVRDPSGGMNAGVG